MSSNRQKCFSKVKPKIFIAGQEGMVGSAILRLFKKKKLNIISCTRKELDLTNQNDVKRWINKKKPEIVINAAGRVGGILDNSNYKSDYIYINSMIGMNLIHSSLNNGVKKFINLGSACIYPKNTKQPIKEEQLLDSALEQTNEGYALAKISTLKYCEYLKQKFKKDYISLQPTNLYGENDNFNLKSSHVLPALVKKFYLAKKNNKKEVEVWGSGKVKREFLNVDDLADAIYFCIKKKIQYSYLNIGSGDCVSIKDLAYKLKFISKFKGKIKFNKKYPDGVSERKLVSFKINKLGWKKKITLDRGLKLFYEYYEDLINNNER